MELTTEQKARVFAMYIGQRVSTPGRSYHPSYNGIDKDGKAIMSPSTLADCHEGTFSYDDFKLHLKPLSAITDEDAEDFITIRGSINWKGPQDKEAVRKFVLAAIGPPIEQGFGFHWETHSFLLQRGYAVPCFISPGHPDNGKTPIELGLAIEAV